MSSFFYRNLKKTYPTLGSAKGVWVTDSDGKSYLDGSSSAIVANLGYSLDKINQAIFQQLSRAAYAHTSQFVAESALALAGKLMGLTPPGFGAGGRVYFTSGGSEAVETALKMARAYFVEQGMPKRRIVISRWQSYHGSTLGALSATGHKARRQPYLPLLQAISHIHTDYRYRCQCGYGPGPCPSNHCALNCANELEQAILRLGPENVMAFIAEPIVGATLGAAVPAGSYWPRIREICQKWGILLIADEVMTGLGRAGFNFAIENWNVIADIIVLGKGLAAGYQPLGAVLASGQVVAVFEGHSGLFEHGFTYSGHPVACAAGLACLDYLVENNLVAAVNSREAQFFERLMKLYSQFEFIGDVRGKGFLAGLEFVKDRGSKEPFDPALRMSHLVTSEALKEGLIVYPGSAFIDGARGDHIMIAPPFTITDEEMDELFSRLARTLSKVESAVLARDGKEICYSVTGAYR